MLEQLTAYGSPYYGTFMLAVNLPGPAARRRSVAGLRRVRLWEGASQERDGVSPRAPPPRNVTALGNATWQMVAGRYAGCNAAAAT